MNYYTGGGLKIISEQQSYDSERRTVVMGRSCENNLLSAGMSNQKRSENSHPEITRKAVNGCKGEMC